MKILFHITAKTYGRKLFTLHDVVQWEMSEEKHAASLGTKVTQIVLTICDYF